MTRHSRADGEEPAPVGPAPPKSTIVQKCEHGHALESEVGYEKCPRDGTPVRRLTERRVRD